MALPKIQSAEKRNFDKAFDPYEAQYGYGGDSHSKAQPYLISDPRTGVGNPLQFPDPRPSPAAIAKKRAEEHERRLIEEEAARRLEYERQRREEKERAKREKEERAREREEARLQRAKEAEEKQAKLESQRKMQEVKDVALHGHSTGGSDSHNTSGYEGSFTQEAAYEVANATKNGKLPIDDAQYLLKLLQRHYGESNLPANQGTPYGVGFDLMSEIEEQLEIVRAMKNQVFTFSGSVKPGIDFKDAKAVMDSNHKMIGTLMTHMKELVNMRALQEIEEATHKAIETLPAEYAEKFHSELEKRLKGRGK